MQVRGGRLRSRRWLPAGVVCSAALLVAGCAGGGDDDGKTATTRSDKERSSGTAVKELQGRLGETAGIVKRAGCTVSTPEKGEAQHVGDTKDVEYSSDPPTSGEHYPDWAPFGFYDEPVEDGFVVHNLEHGGVALWYGDEALSDDRLDVVRDEVLDDKEKWLVTPRDDLDGIAVGAWGALMACSQASLEKLDDEAFREVLDEWYDATNSQETEAEKDVPAYAGAMPEPRPERDISQDPPESFGS